jgi:hypothetical protein
MAPAWAAAVERTPGHCVHAVEQTTLKEGAVKDFAAKHIVGYPTVMAVTRQGELLDTHTKERTPEAFTAFIKKWAAPRK